MLDERPDTDRDDEQAVGDGRRVAPATHEDCEAGNHEGQAGDSGRVLRDETSHTPRFPKPPTHRKHDRGGRTSGRGIGQRRAESANKTFQSDFFCGIVTIHGGISSRRRRHLPRARSGPRGTPMVALDYDVQRGSRHTLLQNLAGRGWRDPSPVFDGVDDLTSAVLSLRSATDAPC